MKAKGVLPPRITFPSLYFFMELEHLTATSCPAVNAPHPKAPQEFFLWSFSVPGCFLDALLGLSPSTAEEGSGQCSVPPSRHPRRAGSCVPRAAHFSLGQAWGTGGTPKFPQPDTHSTPPEDGKSVARRFWSQSHAGCSCESKTKLPKGSTIRLSPQVLFMEGGVV